MSFVLVFVEETSGLDLLEKGQVLFVLRSSADEYVAKIFERPSGHTLLRLVSRRGGRRRSEQNAEKVHSVDRGGREGKEGRKRRRRRTSRIVPPAAEIAHQHGRAGDSIDPVHKITIAVNLGRQKG